MLGIVYKIVVFLTDHLNALNYEYLTYHFKRDNDIYVFLPHWQNVEI